MPRASKKKIDIIDSSKTIADEAILSAVLGITKIQSITNPEKLFPTTVQMKKILSMRKRFQNGEPLAYVLGEKWFYGLLFKTDKRALIPRPETEILVEKAINYIELKKPKAIFDIGTGSGIIAITLAKKLGEKIVAVDISVGALALAKSNAKQILKTRKTLVTFRHSDMLKKIKTFPDNSLVIANLPYLSKKELREPSIKKEPHLALYGGYKGNSNSSAMIIALLKQIAERKLEHVTIMLEFNYNQAKQISAAAERIFKDPQIEIIKDFSGFDRIAVINI
jgi:release factor glutamine methyltransferase